MTVSAAVQAPYVALVGRPNVGKSTLFNRLLGKPLAVTSPLRGTTRDRLYGSLQWQGKTVGLMDTGGRDFTVSQGMDQAVQASVREAVAGCALCILVCDGAAGLLPADQFFLDELRRAGKPMIVAVNKLDGHSLIPAEFFSLGVAPVIAVSALHGRGTGDLLDAVVERLPQDSLAAAAQPAWSMAIVGRQNVGKSSLLNGLVKQQRAIVTDIPGTTRDSVDSVVDFNSEQVRVVDTAGLRHRRKVRQLVDWFSMLRTRRALSRCDVALMVLDATLGVANDDRRIINMIVDAGCGLVLLANKWDLLKNGNEKKLHDSLRRQLPSVTFAPVLAVSAKTGYHVEQCLGIARRIVQSQRQGIPPALCTDLLRKAWVNHLPPRLFGRAIVLKKVEWVAARPPRLVLTTAPLGALTTPYQHYLLKQLHAHPRLAGLPVKLEVKGPVLRNRRVTRSKR